MESGPVWTSWLVGRLRWLATQGWAANQSDWLAAWGFVQVLVLGVLRNVAACLENELQYTLQMLNLPVHQIWL